jgi:hypothetical protein
MADLAAVNVTVTLTPQDQDFLGMGKRISFPTIAFGNGALNYPALGVPLPAMGAFGMKKEIKRVFIEGQPGDGFVYKYDRTNHTMRIYQVGADPGAPSIAEASAGTPAGSVAAPVFSGAALANFTPAGTVDPGTHVFSGTPASPGTPAGTNTAPAFTGSALAAHTHVLSGATGVAAPLVELGNVAVAAKTLYLMVVGQ